MHTSKVQDSDNPWFLIISTLEVNLLALDVATEFLGASLLVVLLHDCMFR